MKTTLRSALLASLLLGSPLFAQTGVPQGISYQATITDETGAVIAPFPGAAIPYNITLRVFDSATGGTQKWAEVFNGVPVSNGRFSVILGQGVEAPAATNPLDLADVFDEANRFVEISVVPAAGGTTNTFTPRQQLLASPTAMRAKVAESLGTKNNTALTVLNSGNIGIGTTSPGSKLTVKTGGNSRGIEHTDGTISMGSYIGGTSNGGWMGTDTNHPFSLYVNNGSPRLTVATNGDVGIGTTAPTKLLDVAGDARIRNNLFVDANLFVPNIRIGAGGLTIKKDAELIMSFTDNHIAIYKSLYVAGNIAPNGGAGFGHTWNGNEDTGLFWGATNELTLKTGGVERVRVDSSGRMGIGTANPGSKLTVKTGAESRGFEHTDGTVSMGSYIGGSSGGGWMGTVSNHPFSLYVNNGGPRLTVATNGYVGIGTIAPGDELDVVGDGKISNNFWVGANLFVPGVKMGVSSTRGRLEVSAGGPVFNQAGHRFENGTDPNRYDHTIGTFNTGTSIYAAESIIAKRFITFSDERIKKIVGLSDGTADLSNLLRLQVTDYQHVDTRLFGNGTEKKVIAQQVESVLPQAVNRSTDVVPDIYKEAAMNDGWVELATDLKVGERVRLIIGENKDIHEVLEVRKGAFRTAFQPEGDKVFVYGREVNDFRSVDYSAISMLNVSATQELHRLLEAKTKEVDEMKKQLAELKGQVSSLQTKDKNRESRLIAIEGLLSGASTPINTTSK
jgi:hypothetical protein